MTSNTEMISESVKDHTREEWRELGFYYDYDNIDARWRLVGSRDGLRRFCELLDEYIADERNTRLSEHEHYGPYMYLKVVTWTEPQLTKDDIRGTIEDFRRLAELLRRKLTFSSVGSKFEIDQEYSQNNEATLQFQIKEDGFDPAHADPLL